MVGRKRLAVLISGRGSNMEAILSATTHEDYPAEIVLVLSDNPDAAGLHTAKDAGIKTCAFSRRDFDSRVAHEKAIISTIEADDADFVCLAGYMRILSNNFVERFEGRLLNIHPSLLPAYKGLDTHARALADGAELHGCSVHFVNAEMDGGPVIAQSSVPVLADDDEASLAARVLEAEHKLYPQVIRQVAEGVVSLETCKLNSSSIEPGAIQ